MSANNSLNHITAAYPVNGLGDAPSSQSEKDDRLSKAYVHPSWTDAKPVCRDPIIFADMSLNEIKEEMDRFWDLVDDREKL